MKHLLEPILILGILMNAVSADDPPAASDATLSTDEAEVRQVGEAYIAAFNGKDAKALAAFWSPEAVYINRMTGEQVQGREAIAEQFTAIFETESDLKMQVDVESIDFVSPNVAVEKGTARILSSDADADVADYSAVYIRRDGKWLLDRVTDDPQPIVKSNYEQLKELEWMVGRWVDEGDGGKVVTRCDWSKNKNFLARSFTVSLGDRVELSGIQFVGWDPAEKQIRSWTFDSDGGFSQGRWLKDDNRWYIRKKGTTSDGDRATAVNIVTLIDDSTFSLQSTQRTLAGELLPNVDEVVVVRN
ncbi:MAG: SgcJ/EcaC family oxidoreductase [Planctomycetota bacterium]